MGRIRRMRTGAVLITAGLFSICAEASPIVGLVTTNGSAIVNLNNFLFASGTGIPGLFSVQVPTTGSFSTLAGDTGTITNLNNAVETIGGPGPVSFNDPNWMVFSGPPVNANISFDLQYVALGDFTSTACTGSPVPGQTCSLAGSPFDLTNNGAPGGSVTGVTISINLSGTAINTLTSETSHFTGIINNSGQIIDMTTGAQLNNLQQIVAAVEGGDNVQTGYTGAFSATAIPGVPEPSTLAFGSLGVLLLALGSFRRKRA